MAKRIQVPAQTTKIDENVVYVDVTKLKTEIDNVTKASNGIQSALKEISSALNKAVTQKIIKGEKYRKVFKDAISHCNQQATGAQNRLKGLQQKYAADVQTQEKNVLNGQIDKLASEVAKLKEELAATNKTVSKMSSNSSSGDDNIVDVAINTGEDILGAAGSVAAGAANAVSAGAANIAAAINGAIGK